MCGEINGRKFTLQKKDFEFLVESDASGEEVLNITFRILYTECL